MLPLLIRISNKETGAQIEAGFRRSPVRIGRNALNDLAIDESFVSQWHCLVRFDDAATHVLDLGSTNGTAIKGERLDKNVEVEIDASTRLAIGPLRLTFERTSLRDEQILPRRASAFRLGGTSAPARGVGEGGTLDLGASGQAALATKASQRPPAVLPKSELLDMAKRQRALLDELAPLYAAYESSFRALEGKLAAALDQMGNETEREARAAQLHAQLPLAFEHAALRSKAGLPASGDGADAKAWLDRLVPGAKFDDPAASLERAGALLEAFASSFVDLRNGQKQVRQELSIEPGGESATLPDQPSGGALLAYLLDPNSVASDRLDELRRSFADIALHQLGIVSGAIDGARALLMQLSPVAIGAVASGALARTSASFGDVLWPWRAAGHYYRYAAKHFELATGDAAQKHLFGAAFARAYYRVTGRRS